MNATLTALLLGDVIGQPGSRALFIGLQKLVRTYGADLVVVNGENAAAGFGITPEDVKQLFSIGVNVITTGNHVWQKKEIYPLLDSEDRLLRPANYPSGVPGHGSCVIQVRDREVAVVNLQGRLRMTNLQCPFLVGRDMVRKLRKRTPLIFVDFHAEATEEKEALGQYLDGEITALVGTHTHTQTGDERILSKGTGYITDIGMIGPADSVIGIKKSIAVQRSLTQIPIKMEVAETTAVIQGVVIEADTKSGRTVSIRRVSEMSIV